MKDEEILNSLKHEGYNEVYVWVDKPGFVYEKHSHEYETKLVILSGNIEVEIDGKKVNLTSGNDFVIPAWKEHSALVGPDGCKYAVGEGEKTT